MSADSELTQGLDVDLVFWNPQRPELRFSGVLRMLSDADIQLRLVGWFSEEIVEWFGENPRVLFGYTTTGEALTLDECHCLGVTSSRGAVKITLSPQNVLVGGHILAGGLEQIRELYARLSSLDLWAELFLSAEPNVLEQTCVEVEIARIDGYALSIVGSDYSTYGSYKKSIERYVEVRIVADSPKPMSEIRGVLQRFIAFLTLCSSHRVWIERLSACVESVAETRPNETRYHPEMAILGLLRYDNNPRVAVKKHHMLLRRSQLGDRTSEVVSNWLRRSTQLAPVHDTYAFAAHNRELIGSLRFLNLAQTLEVFHRKVLQGPTSKEHKQLISEIVSSSPETHREWLKLKLQHSHEPTLRDRLQELGDAAIPVIDNPAISLEALTAPSAVVRPTSTAEALAIRASKWRNQLTHHSGKMHQFKGKELELVNLTRWLTLVTEYWLLRDAGLSEDSLRGLFAANRRYVPWRYSVALEIEYSNPAMNPIDVGVMKTPASQGEVF